jgi:hypothetical protein
MDISANARVYEYTAIVICVCPRVASFPPPALRKGGHRGLARCGVAMGRRAILMMPESECPHPRHSYGARREPGRCGRQRRRSPARRNPHRSTGPMGERPMHASGSGASPAPVLFRFSLSRLAHPRCQSGVRPENGRREVSCGWKHLGQRRERTSLKRAGSLS